MLFNPDISLNVVATVVNLYICCVPAVLKEADVQAWFQSLENSVFASIFAVIFYVWFHSEAELESLIVSFLHTPVNGKFSHLH